MKQNTGCSTLCHPDEQCSITENGRCLMEHTTTLCWNCSTEYGIEQEECPHCCATNANYDIESAQMEMADKSHIDHDWKFQDDSFDHEFGTERVHYWQCEKCGATRQMEAGDYDVEDI